ncbi:MAG: hypothetical protein RMK29_17690 [Myxococcales bacterium]|nr:hypothetical protein [Myxococcota bacterium]MDW8283543.1 hypothetical protein [Myxococcales bacterium]
MWTTAFVRVLRRPALVLAVWLMTLLPALLASLPVLLWLKGLLDHRPAAAELARGEADPLLGEILQDQPAAVPLLLGSLLGAALPGWLLSAAASGGLLDALRRPGHPRRVVGRAVVVRMADTAPAMLRLWGAGLALRLPVVALLGGAGLALRKLLPGRGLSAAVVAVAATAVVGALLWSLLSVVLHYARLHRLGAPDRPGATWRALRGALRCTRQHLGPTLGLAAVSVLGLAVLVGVGRAVALHLDARPSIALAAVLGLGWRQLVALGRTGFHLALLAAVVEVADSQHPEQVSEIQATSMTNF